MHENNRFITIGSFMLAISWLVCIVSLFIFFSPVEAHAAEEDTYWLEAMDYGGFSTDPNAKYGTTSYFTPAPGTNTFYIVLPRLMVVKYVDIIVYTGGGWWPAGLTFKAFGNSLNVQRWGPQENYWRLYGPVTTSKAQYDRIELNVTNPTSGNLYMDVLSAKVSSNTPYSDVSATWSIYQDSHTEDGSFPSVNAADWASPSEEAGNLRIEIPYGQWLNYQHIDLMMLFDVAHIDGITACLVNDQGFIPVSTQYLNNDDYPDAFNMLSISVDLTNVQPAQTNLRIYITFHTGVTSYNNFILYSIHGWSPTFAPNTYSFWFPKLIDALNQGFSSMYTPPEGASPPTPSPGMSGAQEVIQGGIGAIEQDLNLIATVPRPDLGSIDMPSSRLDDIDYNSNVSHLTMITHSQPFRLIFFFAALFMVIGTVIYGRRG